MRTLGLLVFLVPALATAAPIERRLHSDNIDASSFLWNDWNKFVENYHPNYVADDDPTTAWVEGAKGSGAGEWLRIQVTPLDKTTKVRLKIRNGYQKSKDLFKANARAKQITLRLLPSKVEKQVTLEDKDGWQEAVVEQPSGVVKTIEVAIKSVYEGTKYEDLCISDVQVYATSETPDNPAFEKQKHDTLMQWRAGRLAAAKIFKNQKTALPLYPAYEITSTEAKVDYDVFATAMNDKVLAGEWKDALAIAKDTLGSLDELPRAQVAPTSQDRLVASDGLQIPRLQDESEGYDEEALHLPMLDYVSTLFADQLRMLDVKDTLKVSEYKGNDKKCGADVTWVKRTQPKEQNGPAKVQAIALGRCGRVSEREGYINVRMVEVYVYDSAGRLALVAGDTHVDAYRWVMDNGKPMLAGGRSILPGKIIDAKKREAVAAK